MLNRVKFTAEAFEKYLDGLDDKFNTSIVWDTLQGKSEYGTAKSEKGYQTVAAIKAALMARKLGLNEERASFYTKCIGAAFPPYGNEGKKCIKQYAAFSDLPYDEKETMATVIEESIVQSGKIVVEGLRELLLDLFDEAKDSDVKEIELAKLYHTQMEILKLFDRVSPEHYTDGEKLLDDKIDKTIEAVGISECKRRLIDYKHALPVNTNGMSDEEKEKYFASIDAYREYAGDECLVNFILHAHNPT